MPYSQRVVMTELYFTADVPAILTVFVLAFRWYKWDFPENSEFTSCNYEFCEDVITMILTWCKCSAQLA